MDEKEYESYVKKVTPTTSLAKNMFMAFLAGGIICLIGQVLINLFIKMGLEKETAINYETLILVFSAILLTGLNVYQKLAKHGGAGTLVPITGFANSVGSCAIEFKKEGQVFGIGCKIFTIAGPVILYGLFSSSLLGFIYWIYTLFSH
ncbi:MAG: SpoVA/SpoVAEb family sporulation membrane protein [Lachnospiraceae bacterium]|nr:SpoVA/SpoVAEb family sporulation membrane protein [Lachnospiraceae bacterium]